MSECIDREGTLSTVLGSPAFLADVLPRVEPFRSYRRCRRTSVGKTLPITTNLACRVNNKTLALYLFE